MPLAEADVGYLRTLVARRSGNILSSNHGYLLEARLTPVAERLGLPNVEALVAELKRSPIKYEDTVAEAMTINETSFFRDLQPFETLRKDLIPKLMNTRAGTRQLHIWCAATSSGQEPYTIAMILRDNFPQLVNWSIRIIATDLSDEMLHRTREGVYSQFEVNRGLPAKLLVKYFQREGTSWRVIPELRNWIECHKLNLVSAWPSMPRFDIVFIRNVLIYFDQATKESVLQRAARIMAPDGSLFLGGGESLVGLNVPYTRETYDKTICYRPALNTPVPPVRPVSFN